MATRTWQRPSKGWWDRPAGRWAIGITIVVYLVIALQAIDINFARIARGWARLFEVGVGTQTEVVGQKIGEILRGLGESLAMAVIATPLGILLAIPIGFGAAHNVSTKWVYYICRSITVLSRGFHEIVIAILLVKMVGFGPLAGVLTLAIATVGFYGKLFAEAIEESDGSVREAVQASGAGWLQQMVFGIIPQVKPRMIGLGLYRLDINVRESTVIGVVGAGGIGATLETTFDRYEYVASAVILALIIGLVFALEAGAGWIRRRYL
ncbi:MAG: phosphonate ABC transporter, permease protein PhnE [Verrucomicrobiales bacterium]|nr:phosphonate ABC transporter, permease protein PhnE [Verrucomicrobiales bacterium]